MGLLDKFLDGAGYLAGEAARRSGVAAGTRAVKSGVSNAKSAIGDGVERAAIATGKGAYRAAIKKTPQSFYNGYTGMKPTVGLNVAAWGGAALYGIAGMKRAEMKEPVGTQVEYEGQSSIKSGDGMGMNASAPTLGASGSLVFGLNSMRRG